MARNLADGVSTENVFSVLTPSAKFLAISQTGRMSVLFAELAELQS